MYSRQSIIRKKPSVQYIQERGVSYTGEIMASEFDASVEEASRVCNMRPECIGFYYNHITQTAVLSQTRVEKYNAMNNSYFRKVGTLDANPLVHPNLSILSPNPMGIAFTYPK